MQVSKTLASASLQRGEHINREWKFGFLTKKTDLFPLFSYLRGVPKSARTKSSKDDISKRSEKKKKEKPNKRALDFSCDSEDEDFKIALSGMAPAKRRR